MGAYKKLNKQDVYITSRTAHKTYTVANTAYTGLGITIQSVTGSLYNSLKQLYYPSKSEGNVVSHSYDYYDQTTIYNPDTRQNLQSGSTNVSASLVISIPRNLYGTYIKPGPPFKLLMFDMPEDKYILQEYAYWDDISAFTPAITNAQDVVIEQIVTRSVVDDQEGGLYVYNSDPRKYVGDIIYSHGIIVLTDPIAIAGVRNTTTKKSEITWQTSHPIFTHTYNCKIKESEFNYTYNPSALSNSIKTTYDNMGNIYSTSVSSSNGDFPISVDVINTEPLPSVFP